MEPAEQRPTGRLLTSAQAGQEFRLVELGPAHGELAPRPAGATPMRARFGIWLHLIQCEACRRYFDQVRRTVRLLASGPPAPLEPRTERSLLDAAHRPDRHEV